MHLTSVANPIVKSFAKLAEKKYRTESGLFWLEGAEYVARAVTAGWDVVDVMVEEGATSPVPASITTTRQVLAKITGKENPQPVLGLLKPRWPPLPPSSHEHWLASEKPRDPGSTCTILRTADAAGVAGCILVGEATDPFAPECARATVGSVVHVPLVTCTEAEFVAWAKGKQVIGTHLKATHSYRSLTPSNPCVVLMGNESAGLTDTLTAACTQLIKIPMVGHTESLNVATATALMLYEIQKDTLR